MSGNLNDSHGSWTLMRAAEGGTRVVHWVSSDPGGLVWNRLENLATRKGPEPLLESARRPSADPAFTRPAGKIPDDCESPSD